MTDSRFNEEVFETWLDDQPKEFQPLAKEIRNAVVSSGHNFQEAIKWGSPCYWLPEISRRNIIWFQHHNDYIRLGFFNGATMPDPDNLLEGTGKRLRHIKVYEVNDTNRQTLANYIQASTRHAMAEPTSLSG